MLTLILVSKMTIKHSLRIIHDQVCQQHILRRGLQVALTNLAPVVQRLDNAIHQINHYPADSVVCFVNEYPLDSDLSGG